MSLKPHDANGKPPLQVVSKHPFDVDTAVGPLHDRVCSGQVSRRWHTHNGTPNGGYLLAICLHALQQVTERRPMVITGLFLRPASVGPTQIGVELIRAGRRLTTAEAHLVQSGKEIVRATAVFGDQADPDIIASYPPPALAPPDTMMSSRDLPVPGVPFSDQLEYRAAEIPGFLRGQPSGVPRLEFWVRFVPPRQPDLLSLALFVDAFPPVVIETGHLSSTVTLTAYLRAVPAPGWLACRIQARHIAAGVHDQDLDIWDSKGAFVAQGRQLAVLTA